MKDKTSTVVLSGAGTAREDALPHTTRPFLLTLPPEILRYILEYAVITGSLPRIAATCRALRPLALELLYKTLTIGANLGGLSIHQIESLMDPDHSGLKFTRDLRILDCRGNSSNEYPEGLSSDDIATIVRPIMEMHLRLLLRRFKPGQLRGFHLLTHQEDRFKTLPILLLNALKTRVEHLSLPQELIRAWVDDLPSNSMKSIFRGLESFRLTNLYSSQDFNDLWGILEDNVDSLKTLYLSAILKYGQITWDLFCLDGGDPVFRCSLAEITSNLIAMRTNIHLVHLQHLRLRGIANLHVLRNVSCNNLFNLYGLRTLRLDSCAAADEFISEIGRNNLAPNLRSLQLFGSCNSQTLNQVIPLLQPLETLYLSPYLKAHPADLEKLSFQILNRHRATLIRLWFEDPMLQIPPPGIATPDPRSDLGDLPRAEEVAFAVGHSRLIPQINLPLNIRLLRILDSFPSVSDLDGPQALIEYAMGIAERHVARCKGQKPALSLISFGPYRSYLDTQDFVTDDVRVKLFVSFEENDKMVWVPVLTMAEPREIQERYPEFDIVHGEGPEGPWQPEYS
ncbi:hypothetical protein TWF730_006274 [Orbilia blumenaviensis]|uniref:F-box domain-containing protein n=1 Tax=Orbilia blumenaviensis TaxID=1796055 RepID=A0AAV9VDQ9_9PEZI